MSAVLWKLGKRDFKCRIGMLSENSYRAVVRGVVDALLSSSYLCTAYCVQFSRLCSLEIRRNTRLEHACEDPDIATVGPP